MRRPFEGAADKAEQDHAAANRALQYCINQLRQRELSLREWKATLNHTEVAEGEQGA